MPDKEVKRRKRRTPQQMAEDKAKANPPEVKPPVVEATVNPEPKVEPVIEQPVTPPIVEQVQSPVTVAIAPPPEPKKWWDFRKPDASVKVKKVGGRRWWLIGLGGAILALGIAGIVIYAISMNMAVGSVSVFGLVGGAVAVYYGMQVRDSGIILTASGKGGKPAVANAFNIYKDRLAFELMPEDALLGQPRKCRNDGKFYYVHTTGDAWRGKDTDANKLVAFTLPDTQYRNPTEFANNLNIPAHRELAKKRSTLFQKLSPALILVGMMIVFVLWIATSPAPSATASVNEQSTHPVQVGGK